MLKTKYEQASQEECSYKNLDSDEWLLIDLRHVFKNRGLKYEKFHYEISTNSPPWTFLSKNVKYDNRMKSMKSMEWIYLKENSYDIFLFLF